MSIWTRTTCAAFLLSLCWPGRCAGTERPIIGILAQETSGAISRLYPDYDSYIAASYVKAVQASGARVVPVFIKRDLQYYRRIVRSVNGLLFPGGSTWFYNHPGGYADAGQMLFQEAKAANQNGTHFPTLGICLGFELLLFLDVDRKEYRADCNMKNLSLHLDFKPDFRASSLFAGAPEEIINILSSKNVTYNQHQFCVTEGNMTSFGLSDRWNVLTTNEDRVFNLTFVSSVESRDFPFFGLQFHPEKNGFEWRPDLRIPHSEDAIRASRFFLDRLVQEARKNGNSFSRRQEEEDSLIANYHPEYTKNRLAYDEVYLFKDRSAGSIAFVSLVVLTLSLIVSIRF